MFIRLVKGCVPAGRESDLYSFWEWASERVQQQPGNLRGYLRQSAADPRQFLELHLWVRQEDSTAYRSCAQFQEVMQTAAFHCSSGGNRRISERMLTGQCLTRPAPGIVSRAQ